MVVSIVCQIVLLNQNQLHITQRTNGKDELVVVGSLQKKLCKASEDKIIIHGIKDKGFDLPKQLLET